MTYDEALAFWFGRVNYEQTAPDRADLKLDRMRVLLARLGNPHERLRIIHVAGSKGKGSTSAMLAAILQRAGYRTGLFTSPHLCRVEERIQVDRTPISADELAGLMAEVREAVEDKGDRGQESGVRSQESGVRGQGSGVGEEERGGPSSLTPVPYPLTPTFFEVATALGFLHFAKRGVDVAVVEVGLGGRFDSTNVCRPLLAVITSISYDHTDVLGHRLASIAMEKAGIVKAGCATVSGVRALEAREVIDAICRERGSPLHQLGVDFHSEYETGRVTSAGAAGGFELVKPRVHITTARRKWPVMELGLLGEHQAANAAVAVACVEQLQERGLRLAEDAVRGGLADVQWPARLEVFGGRPLVVLDCAHNVASVEALLQTLEASFPRGRRLLVFAGSSDKDLAGMLRLLEPHFAHAFLTRYTSPRSVAPERLGAMLSGLPFTVCPTPREAWEAARAAAGPEDLICVTGSVFLAGDVRPLLTGRPEAGNSCGS